MRRTAGIFLVFLLAATSAGAQSSRVVPQHVMGVAVGPDGRARIVCLRHDVEPPALRGAEARRRSVEHLFATPPPSLRWDEHKVYVPARRSPGKTTSSGATFQVDYNGFTAEAQQAFQYAVDIWSTRIESDVTIRIEANWDSLAPGVLGSAGPTYLDDADLGLQNWYASALANAIRGSDGDTGKGDVLATFSNEFGSWYFGLDGRTPSNRIDFVTVVLHEIGHGLGFLGSMKVDDGSGAEECNGASGVGCWGFESYPDVPVIFDRFVEDASGSRLINRSVYPNPSGALGDVLAGGPLLFAGPEAVSTYGARPPLYAPSTWNPGSSYAHLDEAAFQSDPSALMTPSVSGGEAIHDPGPIGCAVFSDIGWETAADCSDVTTPIVPGVPALLSPADEAGDVVQPVTFMWESADDAESYDLQVSSDEGFGTTIVAAAGVETTSYTLEEDLAGAATYHWRVRARNGDAVGDYSEAFSFTTVEDPPEAPQLETPADGEDGVDTEVTLRWSGAASADAFDVQLAESATFAPSVVSESTQGTSLLVSGLAPDTPYFWRVRGVNTGGAGSWSDVHSFTTTISLPSPPQLQYPADEAVGIDTALAFQWLSVVEAASYEFQLGTDSTVAVPEVDVSGIDSTSLAVDGLARETTYYWRLRSLNGQGTSGWSPVFRFTTFRHLPIVPTPIVPADTAEDVEIPTVFGWTAAAGADYYELQLAEGTTFGTLLVDTTRIDSTQLVLDGLTHETTYVWRVRAVNAAGRSVWTQGVVFTTRPAANVGSARDEVPGTVAFLSAYPNPFSDRIRIELTLPSEMHVRLSLFDVRGRRIAVLLDERRSGGSHTVGWAAPELSAGIYFLRLEGAVSTASNSILYVPRGP